MTKVLGKVATGAQAIPRGPDVKHRIRVLADWLETGRVIDVELPRNLACAACDGGGCDACDRSGAITLRGRDDSPEVVQVTVPAMAADGSGAQRGVVLRIPFAGGLPRAEESLLPRGILLLTLVAANEPDPGVSAAKQSVRTELAGPEGGGAHERAVAAPAESGARRDRLWLWVAIGLAVWIGFLLALRMYGCH